MNVRPQVITVFNQNGDEPSLLMAYPIPSKLMKYAGIGGASVLCKMNRYITIGMTACNIARNVILKEV